MPEREFGEREMELLGEVIASGQLSSLSGGQFAPRFEREFAAAMGAKHAVSMNSAMSVLHASVAAAGAGAGDEVICDPVVVFGAAAALYQNAIPVFVDVDPITMNMNPAKIAEKITERTKAIIVTHLWGLPAEMDPIMEIARRHRLVVIEDCAHALLATYRGKYAGTLGDIGSFSFQMSKQMGLGDGGMGTTDDEALAKALGLFGGAPTFLAVAHGLHWNYRMNEQTAAIGVAQLERAPGYVRDLTAVARLYDQAAEGCPWLAIQRGGADAISTYHFWAAVFWGDRHGISFDAFRQALQEEECRLSIGYTGMPAYRHPLIRDRMAHGFHCPLAAGTQSEYAEGLCPVAEEIIPRVVLAFTFGADDHHQRNAAALRRALERLG